MSLRSAVFWSTLGMTSLFLGRLVKRLKGKSFCSCEDPLRQSLESVVNEILDCPACGKPIKD